MANLDSIWSVSAAKKTASLRYAIQASITDLWQIYFPFGWDLAGKDPKAD